MKIVQAYEALDGSLHKAKVEAAKASIMHLGKMLNNDMRGQSIGHGEVAFIVQHRKKIIDILSEVDAPDSVPDCGCNDKDTTQ